jgi:hypothetical protein
MSLPRSYLQSGCVAALLLELRCVHQASACNPARFECGSTETLPTLRRSKDMSHLERMLFLTDRILMHLDHEVPPETEVILELKEAMVKVRQEHGLPKPVTQLLPGSPSDREIC